MRLLILYHQPFYSHSSANEYLNAFGNYSKYEVKAIDCYRADIVEDLAAYDVVVVHYSIIIVSDSYLSPYNRLLLKNYAGLKVLIIQDEFRWVNETVSCMEFINFDILLTCVPESEWEKVYPAVRFPNLLKRNVLTGYVSEEMQTRIAPLYEDRSMDVVYRAHKLSAWYGVLGQEKWEIAHKFNLLNKESKLLADVSYKTEDRIYGKKWLNFLMTSKAALGTESGASVFDFDDRLRIQVEAYEKANPSASFKKIKAEFFRNKDGKIKLNQISPRCFEYASCRTLMVLFEGEYSGILKPWIHYLPLKKDFSNFPEIIDAIRNKEIWEKITAQAFEDLIKSSKYTFKNYIYSLDNLFEETARSSKKSAGHFLNLEAPKVSYCSLIIKKIKAKVISLLAVVLFKRLPYLKSLLKLCVDKQGLRSVDVLVGKYSALGLLKNTTNTLCLDEAAHRMRLKNLGRYKICPKCKWAFKGYKL
jgi:hypothetical protein